MQRGHCRCGSEGRLYRIETKNTRPVRLCTHACARTHTHTRAHTHTHARTHMHICIALRGLRENSLGPSGYSHPYARARACTHTHTHTRTHTHTPHHAAQQFSCEVQVGPYSCCLLLIRTTTRSPGIPGRPRRPRRWPTLWVANSLRRTSKFGGVFDSPIPIPIHPQEQVVSSLCRTSVKRWRSYGRYCGKAIGGPAPNLALAMKWLRRQLLRD